MAPDLTHDRDVISPRRMDLYLREISSRRRIGSQQLRSLPNTVMETQMDTMLDDMVIEIRRAIPTKPLPYVNAKPVTRQVHLTVPRTWWDWRRVAKGKPPRRTRDIAIEVNVVGSAIPLIWFPELADREQFVPSLFGRVEFSWTGFEAAMDPEAKLVGS